MEFYVLASGSKGNCLLLVTAQTRLLVDCGIGISRIKEKLRGHNLTLADINGVLITHGHNDHVKGLASISQHTTVFLSRKLYAVLSTKVSIHKPNTLVFSSHDKFYVGDIFVWAVPVLHDCVEPVGFVFYANGKKMGMFTDIGKVTDDVVAAMDRCHTVLIEANHDVAQLTESSRPWFLKNRILCNTGHLSNRAAGRLLADIYHPDYLREVVLLHLSQDCNSPERALHAVRDEMVRKAISFYNIHVAHAEGTVHAREVGFG